MFSQMLKRFNDHHEDRMNLGLKFKEDTLMGCPLFKGKSRLFFNKLTNSYPL